MDVIQALTFDVFGTVVDWRGSIIDEGAELNRVKGLSVDWAAFADAWRGKYGPSMERVRRGDMPWTNLDGLHRASLDELLVQFGIDSLTDAEKDHLNRVWHRLRPWPDGVPGLTRLRTRYVLSPLSNGNVALLTNMAKHAGLPWDCILSAELAKKYKPDPLAYQTAVDLLGLQPNNVMMVAAHAGDLRAARSIGMRTAYVPRPQEWGPNGPTEDATTSEFDMVAADFLDLAGQVGT